MNILEELMQGMAKLVEHSACLVGTQQCRFAGCWFGEVANYGNYRYHLFPLFVCLVAISSAPCTATL